MCPGCLDRAATGDDACVPAPVQDPGPAPGVLPFCCSCCFLRSNEGSPFLPAAVLVVADMAGKLEGRGEGLREGSGPESRSSERARGRNKHAAGSRAEAQGSKVSRPRPSSSVVSIETARRRGGRADASTVCSLTQRT